MRPTVHASLSLRDGQRAPEDAGDFEWFNGGEFGKEHFND